MDYKLKAAEKLSSHLSCFTISTKLLAALHPFTLFTLFCFLLLGDFLCLGESVSSPGLDLAKKLSQQNLTFLPSSLPDSLAQSDRGTVPSADWSELSRIIPSD
eukprot:TRINITY_DN15963_c0_g2_i1.p1 TRINITY_DN15963_c0_g2~~TRINITY_DN15963_c0_g2_i1.p1  ORF type:complete len:103 (+),score=24.96 TRINITY_DN15963_c0_g2_i1:75-383(+)